MPRSLKQGRRVSIRRHAVLNGPDELHKRSRCQELAEHAATLLQKKDETILRDEEEALFKGLRACGSLTESAARRRGDNWEPERLAGLRRQLIDRLVERNLGLVYEMRTRCGIVGLDPEEMLSEGFWTLYRAVESFDPWRGFRFSTYACRSILHAFALLGRRKRRRREVLAGLQDQRRVKYDEEVDADALMDGQLLLERVNEALASNSPGLTSAERYVIERRFLSGNADEPPTLERIGRTFRVSKERVRQIQIGAIAKLRAALGVDESSPDEVAASRIEMN